MSFKDDITFVALSGHVLELKYPGEYNEEWGKWKLEDLPIVPDKFEYKLDKKKSYFYNRVKDELNSGKYDYVINACDAGREGQLIFHSVYGYLGCTIPVKRFWISDQSDKGIKKALNNLFDETELTNLTKSAFLRSYFDWLVGINLSRATSLKTQAKVPVGRVMTPTLAIIVNREKEILNFKPEDYWIIEVLFNGYHGTWFDKQGNGETKINTEEKAKKVYNSITDKGKVESADKRLITNYAPELYSLLTLQKDANNIYGYTASETLDIAQKLYDDLKLITYPRTESSVISTNMVDDMIPLLNSLKDIDEYSDTIDEILKNEDNIKNTLKKKMYVDDTKLTDHHGLIPTPTKVNLKSLNEREKNVYELVLRRFISIFMEPFKYNKSTIIISSNNNFIKVSGKEIVDRGYKVLYNTKEKETIIPNLSEGEIVGIKDKKIMRKQTTPPNRYTDSSLLDAMDNAGRMVEDKELRDILKRTKGIGTSATRDGYIEKLIKNNMTERKGKTIYPTSFGMDVIDVLGERDITSPGLTAIWEERLGKIEDGELSYEDFYDDMISYTEEQTINISKEVDKNLNGEKMVLGKCPKCGEDVIKGKKYYLCSKYKDTCDFIIGKEFFGVKISDKDVEKILQGETTRKMNFTFKNGKKGTGRLQYNKEEKNIKIIFEKKERKKIGKCPKCGEEMVDGKSYYICSKYKDTCDFIVGKKILGANVGIADIKALISGKETGEKEFTWKSGKKGNAKLKLNEDGKIKFVFSNNKE